MYSINGNRLSVACKQIINFHQRLAAEIDGGIDDMSAPDGICAKLGLRGSAFLVACPTGASRCHFLETGKDSFRFKAGSAAAARKKKEDNHALTTE